MTFRKKYLISLVTQTLLIFLFKNVAGQNCFFEIAFGGPGTQICNGMIIAPDSSIYMVGNTSNGTLGGMDIMLSKISPCGQILWTTYFGTTEDDYGNSILLVPGPKLVIAGGTNSSTLNGQVFIIETDTSGIEIAQHVYGTTANENINSIKSDPYGNFILAGYQSVTGSNYSYVLKLDSLFQEVWFGTFGTGLNDYCIDLFIQNDGSIYVSSDRKINTGGGTFDYDINLTKLDSSGTVMWDSTYFDPYQNGTQGLILNQSDHFLIFGETEIYQFSPFDYFIVATDTSGNLLWRQTFGGNGANALFDLIEDVSGNLVGTGYGNTQSGGIAPINASIIKTDPLGNLIWQREYGFGGVDIGFKIIEAASGGYYIAGRATTTNDDDFYLLKVDTNGLLTSISEFPELASEIRMYPNPVNNMLHIDSHLAFDSFKLYDMTGRLVFHQEFEYAAALSVSVTLPHFSDALFVAVLSNHEQPVYRSIIKIQNDNY